MLKRLRENRKSKKGFTLVELIVVIVIILVLSAVMVPNVLKYVEKSQKANCKADAGTILVDLQAQIADLYATDTTSVTLPTTAAGATVASGTAAIPTVKNTANYVVTDGEVTYFAYFNGKFNAVWQKTATGASGGGTGTPAGWSGTCMN